MRAFCRVSAPQTAARVVYKKGWRPTAGKGNTMTYFLIDDMTTARARVDFDALTATTDTAAIAEAAAIWSALTRTDRADRDAFRVCRGELTADGCPDGDDYDEVADLADLDADEIAILSSWPAAVELMDDEIREEIHAAGITDKIEFLRAYRKAHADKRGEEFTI